MNGRDRNARRLAASAQIESYRKFLLPDKLYPLPKTMATPPTVTPGTGASSPTSAITNSQFISSIKGGSGTTPDDLYTYNVPVMRADWNGTSYPNSFPNNQFMRSFAITPSGYIPHFTVEFAVDGSQFEFLVKGITGQSFRILVDENDGNGYQYVSATPSTVTAAGGLLYLVLVDFAGVRKPRNIKLEIIGGYFGGVRIGPNDTIWKVDRKRGPIVEIFGDSNVEGANATTYLDGFAPTLAKMMGWEVIISGVGGTGFLNDGTSGRVRFGGRIQNDVINLNPDLLLFVGGNNDTSSTYADVKTEALSVFSRLKAGLPKTKIIVGSPFAKINGTSYTQRDPIRQAMKEAAAVYNFPFIDSMEGVTYAEDGTALMLPMGNWFTGTGYAGATQPTGNSSLYVSSDAVHCNDSGHLYMAHRFATEIIRIIKAPTFRMP